MAIRKDFFKYDPVLDADRTFNIDNALNENWDKVNEGFNEVDQTYVKKESGKGLSANNYTNTDKNKVANVPSNTNTAIAGKAAKPSYVESTMLASGWSGRQYSFEAAYPFASKDIEIQPSKLCTTEQMEAFGAAMIAGSSTDHVAEAKGEVPTINIPIIIKVVNK